ncbi:MULTISPECIES: type 1 glutamine amidotransferase family protein [Comamonadaceae]|uniref:hypothetical protein n=1 Tax=Comamonadaceae TaxID=80864 RepID=UPI001D02B2C5|nr:hypothetical protein [Diaphorobacter aerolatus]
MANIKRLIVMVLFEHVYLLDVTGPAEVFSLLQREMDEPTGYEVVLAAATLAPVMTSAGVRVLPDTTFADLAPVGSTPSWCRARSRSMRSDACAPS